MWNTIGLMVVTLAVGTPGGTDTPKRTTDPASDDRALVRLLPNLARDIAALPSRETLLLLLAGTAGSAAVSVQDNPAYAWTLRTGRASYTRVGSTTGEGWVQGTFALGTYVVGSLSHNQAVTHVGSDLVRTQVLNGLVTTGLKAAVDRTRPNGGPHSFPSGHTSASFATAAVLQGHYGWKAGIPAFSMATFIGWSRVRDRAHWPSDIVSGATLGTIVGLTVTRGHKDSTWTVTPTTTAGGFGVLVTKNLSR